MDRAKITIRGSAVSVAGDPAAATDDSYLSQWTASPDNLMWCSLMARSYNGGNVSELYVTVDMTCVFDLSHLLVTAGAPDPIPISQNVQRDQLTSQLTEISAKLASLNVGD